MKTVILCGGKSERLKGYNREIPKPMWEIKGKPLIWHLMSLYANQGFKDFVLCTGYQHEVIESYFKANKPEDWSIIFDNAGENAGTAERVLSALRYVDSENFFCTYADGLCDIDFKSQLNHHTASNKLATISAVKTNLPFGVFKLNQNNQAESFVEKPKSDYWLNGGFFILSKSIKAHIENVLSLEESLFQTLIKRNEVNLYFHNGYWKCMDTYKDYVEMNADFEALSKQA